MSPRVHSGAPYLARSAVGPAADGPPPIDTLVEVETPEHVRFGFQIAGPVRRAWALLIDYTVQGAVLIAVATVLTPFPLFGELAAGVSAGLFSLVLFAVQWGYFAISEALWSGRTIGKRFLGLRVVRGDGNPLDGTAAVLRNLLRGADFLPFGYAVGLVVMAFDERFRRLGDLAADTIVVTEDRRRYAQAFVLHPPPSEQELAWIDRLPPLPHEDLQTIDLVVRRGSQLHAERARELAEILAPVFARRLGVTYDDPWRFLALLHDRPRRRGARR